MNSCPATSAWPTRAVPPFAAMLNPTMAVELPLALLVTASQPLSLDVDQPHPLNVCTVTDSVPPAYPIDSPPLLNANRHGAAA